MRSFWQQYDIQSYEHRQRSLERLKQDENKKEGQLARKGYFDTIPKRPSVDKFKHQYGPKAQNVDKILSSFYHGINISEM